MNKVTAFLPMRKGSERVKLKNIKDFAGIKGGLTYIKLCQLLEVKSIEKIIVSTNDDEVKKIALSFDDNRIVIDNRPNELAMSSTSTDDLINYVPNLINDGIVLWTHVTSPFINAKMYELMINNYFKNLEKYDSLMSVTKIQKFLWDDNKALNYDKNIEKWPRTQTLTPIYEVNSGAFISNIKNYIEYHDRIGEKPFLCELNTKEAFDIDWEEDFEIAELLWNKSNG